MTSRWETWKLHRVNIVYNNFYFYFSEIDMGYLSIQHSKIIHELPFPSAEQLTLQLSPVFSFPNVSPPVALINLILMVCCHLRVEGPKSDLQAKTDLCTLSKANVVQKPNMP